MTRKGLAIACLSTAFAMAVASWAAAQDVDRSSPRGAVRPLGVVAASGDAATGLLSIRGRRLLPAEAQPAPIVVKLGEQELEVLSASDEEIRVALPPGIVPARYPLQVWAGSAVGSWGSEVTVAGDTASEPLAFDPTLRIREARADLGTSTLTLLGEGFASTACPTPAITLADVPLVVVSASETEIQAELPAALAPASYRVRVLRGPEPLPDEGPGTGGSVLLTDAFEVAVGPAAAGEGDITAVLTPAGGGLQGGTTTGSVSLGLLGCAAGQLLKSSGSSWACAADADTDTGVNAVVHGGGVTGSIGGRTLALGSTATSANTAGAIVARNAAGSFSAGSIALAGNLDLPSTTSASVGVLNKGGAPFLHDYGPDSTFVGAAAGNFAVTGGGSTGVGARALAALTSAGGNSAFGSEALLSTTTGSSNTAVGLQALRANTTGGGNSALGLRALDGNTTGSSNSAFGMRALYLNTTGISNSAFGSQALDANTTGHFNAAFGFHALRAATTASSNSAFGYAALAANTTGASNAAFGHNALAANSVSSGNAAFGYSALAANSAAGVSAFGYQALAANTFGRYNSALGYQALAANTTGENNVALGYQALRANTEGYRNVALGYQALTQNVTGFASVAVGDMTLQYNTSGWGNVAVGGSALVANTTGDSNTAVGWVAMLSSTTARYNAAFGDAALHDLQTGEFNVALGARAGYDLTSGNNNIYVGNRGAVAESDTIRVGSSQSATYVAGIHGAASPTGSAVYVSSTGKLGTVPSSRRYKEGIEDMRDGSEVLLGLRPVSFYYRPELDGTHTRQYGLVAEEVAELAPELVARDETGAPQSVRYHFVNAMLLNEVQKQQRQLAELQAEIRALRDALAGLSAPPSAP